MQFTKAIEVGNTAELQAASNEIANEVLTAAAEFPGRELQAVISCFQKLIDDNFAANVDPRIECRKGCSFCCFTRVNVHPGEAAVLVESVKAELATMPRPARRAWMRRLEERAAKVKDFDEPAHWVSKTPCIFLNGEDGTCAVYDIRPIACRYWHSCDWEACRDGWGVRDSKSPQSTYRMEVFAVLVYAYIVTLQRMGHLDPDLDPEDARHDIERGELHNALLAELKKSP